MKEAKPLLNNLRDKGIDGMFAPNESSASGVLEAMNSLELNPRPHLMGFDSSEPLLNAVRAGEMDGLILQDPYKMGYLGVWTLVHYLEGDDVTGPVVGPDGGHLPPGLSDSGKVQGTGEHLITKENVDARSTRELFDPVLQAERAMPHPLYVRRRSPR
jgi:ribose transport system substrate-binding protein